MIRAIIFDIGGVIALDVWEHMLVDHENSLAKKYQLDHYKVFQYGKILWEEFSYLKASQSSEWDELEKKYWKKFTSKFNIDDSIDEIINLTDKFILPLNGMVTLLDQLSHKKIKLAICSNNIEFWLQRQISKLKLYNYFELPNIIVSCRTGISKTSPGFEMFKEAVKALKVEKEHCLFVDDRLENIELALKFGLKTILFPHESEFGAIYLKALLKEMGII